jgi:hypothetical protein
MLGNCHRYPQAVSKSPADWCGEFVMQQAETVELPVVEMQQEPKRRGRKPKVQA